MSVVQWACAVTLPIFGVAFALAFIRLIKGPSLPDRVVAFDLMALIGIGFIATYAVVTGQRVYLDVASVVALIAFLGTVGFAYYLRRKV